MELHNLAPICVIILASALSSGVGRAARLVAGIGPVYEWNREARLMVDVLTYEASAPLRGNPTRALEAAVIA